MTTQPLRFRLAIAFLALILTSFSSIAQDDAGCNAVGGVLITIETDTTEVTVCVGDEISDAVYAKVWEEEGDASSYITTDGDGNIQTISKGIRFEFEGTEVGTSFIYHVSTSGDVNGLDVGSNISDISGCYELSNSIKVNKVDEGDNCGCAMSVSLGKPTAICEGEEITIDAEVLNSNVCTIVCDIENSMTLVEWTMDECHSITNGEDNLDFSELDASYPNADDCVNVSATHVNVEGGAHSCTVPMDGLGGRAMCFSGSKKCYWKDDSEDALKFSVTLTPDQSSTITGLQFYESAPERFTWYNPDFSEDIDEGPNNFPRFYGLRVTVDGEEIFQMNDIPTSNDWTLEEFDFSGIDAFRVEENTTFVFELLAYCPEWRNAITYAWDLDNIKLLGGCCVKDTVITEVDYAWSTGDTGSSITVTPTEDSEYSVTVTDCKGCVATKILPVYVHPPVSANLGDDIVVCIEDLPVTLTQSIEGINSLHPRVEWSTGESGESIQVSEAGTYSVTLTDGIACSDIDEITVSIAEPEPINLPDNIDPVCAGSTLDLSTLEPSGQVGGVWTGSDGAEVSSVGAGTYTYTYSDGNGCTSTGQVTLTEDNFSFSIPDQGPICDDEIFDFSGVVPEGVVADSWTVEDLGQGTYKFTGSNANGCSASSEFNVLIDNLSINLDEPSILCEGEIYMLSDSEPADQSGGTWTNSNGDVVTEANAGTYTYTFTNDNGCSASDMIDFESSGFVLQQLPDDTVCWGDSLLLSSLELPEQSGGVWKDLNNNVVTYGHHDAIFRYHLFDESSSCAGIVAIRIHEMDCPDPCESYTVPVAEAPEVCPGDSISLTMLEIDGFTGGVWKDLNSNAVTLGTIGTYTYNYFEPENGCAAVVEVEIDHQHDGCTDACADYTVSVGSAEGICEDETITLSSLELDGSMGGTWTNAGGETVSSGGPGTYTYSYANADGCTASAQATITEKECVDPCAIFNISFTNPEAICNDTTFDLTTLVSSVASGGEWTNADDQVVTVVGPGIYSYSVTTDAGCSATADVTIVGMDCSDPCDDFEAVIDLGDDIFICQDEFPISIDLEGLSCAVSITTVDDGSAFIDANGIITFLEFGTFPVTVTDGNGQTAVDTVIVSEAADCNVDPCDDHVPSVDLGGDREVCSDQFPISIDVNLECLETVTVTGSGESTQDGSTIQILGPGFYDVVVTDSKGDTAEDRITITSVTCGGNADCTTTNVGGMYVGVSTCSDDSAEGPSSLTVSDAGGLQINLEDQDGTSFAVGLDGCEFQLPEVVIELFGLEITSTGDGYFSGDTIFYNQIIDTDGQITTCNFIGIRGGQVATPCDDGNPNTENDIQIDDCNCCGTPVAGQVIYVDKDAAGAADGSSWADAYTDLQEAMQTAQAGQEIWLADGTYIPTQDGDRDVYFNIPSGVDLYGGFAGTEENLCQRDFTATRTILSGDLAGDDKAHSTNLFPLELLFEGSEENSHYVVRNSQVTDDIKIDGVAITGGVADGTDTAGGGGVLFVNDADATIELTNVLIVQNQGRGLGGAVRINTRSATNLTVILDRVIFLQNRAQGGSLTKGGGLYVGGNLDGFIDMQMTNCIFAQNYSTDRGGGSYTEDNVKATYTNSLYAGNRASDGGAIFENNGNNDALYTNNTFYLNHADQTGGAIVNFRDFGGNTVDVRNSIFFGNATLTGGPAFDNFDNDNNNFAFQNCLFSEAALAVIETEATGTEDRGGNLFGVADPMFTDPLNADFSLQSSSPAVNAGDNSFVTLAEDLGGSQRIQEDIVDMGALESGDGGTCLVDIFELASSGLVQPDFSEVEFVTEDEEEEKILEKAYAEVNTFPNPTVDEINVIVTKTNDDDEISLKLFDISGKSLPTDYTQTSVVGKQVAFKIAVKDFRGGVYFLRTKVGRFTINKRVIVIK